VQTRCSRGGRNGGAEEVQRRCRGAEGQICWRCKGADVRCGAQQSKVIVDCAAGAIIAQVQRRRCKGAEVLRC